jgi:cation-transporting ATPase 13A1
MGQQPAMDARLLRQRRIAIEHLPFLLLHAAALYLCATTMGQPLAQAQEKRKQMEWAAVQNGTEIAEEDLPALPSVLRPSFWALLSAATAVCCHGLMVLAKGWSVRFCAALTCAAAELGQADTVMAVPRKHRGRAELVPVCRRRRSDGATESYFVFQRRKWLLDRDGGVRKLGLPLRLPLREYFAARGLDSAAAQREAEANFGPNRFEIPVPTFWPMYQKQLQQPLCVFQLFSVGLWCLDDYWQYHLRDIIISRLELWID